MQLTQTYKTLNDNVKVDVIEYIRKYVQSHPDVEILIGCDSQNRKRETIYAVVIGLYNPGKGAHVLYSRFSTPRVSIKENSTRLLNEVWYSVEIAEKIKNELNVIAKWIDIDLNPDEKFLSNRALTNAIGIVVGMGYKVRHKGDCPMMTYAGDKLVK